MIAEQERDPNRNPYGVAGLYLQLGENDKGLVWLMRACEERTAAMAFLKTAQTSRQFDGVRKNTRFRRILSCVEEAARPGQNEG